MRHFYASGNKEVYAFDTKKERDKFVSWCAGYTNRRSVTRQQARRCRDYAHLIEGSELVTEKNGTEKFFRL